MSQWIDISNYEEYVMDYVEGSLDATDKAHFEAFLLKHPEVALEVEELKDADLNIYSIAEGTDVTAFKIKVQSVEGMDESNYEEAMALSVDEDLNPGLTNTVGSFVDQNPKLARDFKLYKATKITPDSRMIYAEKASLKQPIPMMAFRPMAYRIAAAVAILFGVISLLNSMQDEVYIPREGFTDYASLDIRTTDPTPEAFVSDQPILTESGSRVAQGVEFIEPMPTLRPKSKWSPDPILEREQPSLAVAQTNILPDGFNRSEQSEELNLAQFVGKEFLGLSPEKTATTKSLLKESAKKVIDQSDQIALNTVSEENNKKTFSLMAGTLEFKRVTYKSN